MGTDIKKAKGSLRNITEIFFTIAVTSAVNSIVVNTLMNKVYSVKRYRLNKFIKDVYNYYCYNTKGGNGGKVTP
tara:strand:+ start:902 stop:1123 length:222 start_codon:yes stop_codon:yes gene_type:complete